MDILVKIGRFQIKQNVLNLKSTLVPSECLYSKALEPHIVLSNATKIDSVTDRCFHAGHPARGPSINHVTFYFKTGRSKRAHFLGSRINLNKIAFLGDQN